MGKVARNLGILVQKPWCPVNCPLSQALEFAFETATECGQIVSLWSIYIDKLVDLVGFHLGILYAKHEFWICQPRCKQTFWSHTPSSNKDITATLKYPMVYDHLPHIFHCKSCHFAASSVRQSLRSPLHDCVWAVQCRAHHVDPLIRQVINLRARLKSQPFDLYVIGEGFNGVYGFGFGMFGADWQFYHVHEILSIFWDASVRSTIESGHDSRTPWQVQGHMCSQAAPLRPSRSKAGSSVQGQHPDVTPRLYHDYTQDLGVEHPWLPAILGALTHTWKLLKYRTVKLEPVLGGVFSCSGW
jgi:hypothetical protein